MRASQAQQQRSPRIYGPLDQTFGPEPFDIMTHASTEVPLHMDIQGLLDDPCFGELIEESKYVDGLYVGTVFVCQSCGEEVEDSAVPDPQDSSCSRNLIGEW